MDSIVSLRFFVFPLYNFFFSMPQVIEQSLFLFFCFPWGSLEPQSFGPNFAFFREALAIL